MRCAVLVFTFVLCLPRGLTLWILRKRTRSTTLSSRTLPSFSSARAWSHGSVANHSVTLRMGLRTGSLREGPALPAASGPRRSRLTPMADLDLASSVRTLISGTSTAVVRTGSRHFLRRTTESCWERLPSTASHSAGVADTDAVRTIVSCRWTGWKRSIALRVFRQNMNRTLSIGYSKIGGNRMVNLGQP